MFAALGEIYYRNTDCVTKVYLGSRISDDDKAKIEQALAPLGIIVKPMNIDKYIITFED